MDHQPAAGSGLQGPARRLTLQSNCPPFPVVPVPGGRTGRSRRWHRGCMQRMVPRCCRGEQRAQRDPSNSLSCRRWQRRQGVQAALLAAAMAAGSSLRGGEKPGEPWVHVMTPDLAAFKVPHQCRRPRRQRGLHQGMCMPQRHAGQILLISRQAWGLRLAGGIAGLGPEQSVHIEVGGKLMEMGEQLPCSSKAGRYQRAEL